MIWCFSLLKFRLKKDELLWCFWKNGEGKVTRTLKPSVYIRWSHMYYKGRRIHGHILDVRNCRHEIMKGKLFTILMCLLCHICGVNDCSSAGIMLFKTLLHCNNYRYNYSLLVPSSWLRIADWFASQQGNLMSNAYLLPTCGFMYLSEDVPPYVIPSWWSIMKSSYPFQDVIPRAISITTAIGISKRTNNLNLGDDSSKSFS